MAKDVSGLTNGRIINIKNYWHWNVQTKECKFSDDWCRSLGYEPNELKHHESTWRELVHPDDMPKVWAVLEPHLQGKTNSYKCKNRLRMKNGLYRLNMDYGKAIERDENGRAIIMEGYDIALAS